MKSLSEIETTSKRASKAAGFSWGISEEIAKGIRLLELFGLPGIKNLNQYFENKDKETKYKIYVPHIYNFLDWLAKDGELDVKLHYVGFIEESKKIKKSIIERKPITIADPNSDISKRFLKIANEILKTPKNEWGGLSFSTGKKSA